MQATARAVVELLQKGIAAWLSDLSSPLTTEVRGSPNLSMDGLTLETVHLSLKGPSIHILHS